MKRLVQVVGFLVVTAAVSLAVLANGGGSGYEGSVEMDVGLLPSFSTSLGADLTLNMGEWSLVSSADFLLYPPIAGDGRFKLLWEGEWLSVGAYVDLGYIPLGFNGLGVILTATAEPWWLTSDTYLFLSTVSFLEYLELGMTFLNTTLDTAGTTTLVGTIALGVWPLPPFSGLLTGTLELTSGDLTLTSVSSLTLLDWAFSETIKLSYAFAPFTASAWLAVNTGGGLSAGLGITWEFSG